MTVAEYTDTDLVQRLTRLYQRARKARESRLRLWARNYNLLRNAFGPSPGVTDWQPQVRDPEIYPICDALVAWVVDQHTNIEVNTAADPSTPFADYMGGVSQDLEIILRTNHEVLDHAAQIGLGAWDNLLYGVGILKAVWDQSLDGGFGNATMRRTDPWRFYVDPNGHNMDDSEHFIEVSELSEEEIERRWPDTAHRVLDKKWVREGGLGEIDRPPEFSGLAGGSGPQMIPDTTKMGGDGRIAASLRSERTGRDNLIRVYECWICENDEWHDEPPPDDQRPDSPPAYSDKHVAKKWRVVVVANRQILLDEYSEDLFSHGTHPYSRFSFSDIGEFYGLTMVDFLASPQEYINRLLRACQYNAELSGNPIMLRATNSGAERVNVMNKPGAIYNLNPGAMQGGSVGMQWMRPPEPSAIIMDLIRFYIDRMQNISGLSSFQSSGSSKPSQDRTSQDSRQAAQDVTFVRVRAGISRLESALEDSYRKQADMVIDNYDDPRYVSILGEDGRLSGMSLRYRHFMVPTSKGAMPLKYQLQIDAGSDAPTSAQARRTQELQLYSLGATDDEALLRSLNYPRTAEMLERKYKKQQAGIQYGPGTSRQRRQPPSSSRSTGKGDPQVAK